MSTAQKLIDFDDAIRSVPRFDGADYDHARDHQRLAGQIGRVFAFMRSGEWHTLGEIAAATGDPEASVSAQLRHLRKKRFGSHGVEKKYLGNGLYSYRLLVNPDGTDWSAPSLSAHEEQPALVGQAVPATAPGHSGQSTVAGF
jgi:hypothetical protein